MITEPLGWRLLIGVSKTFDYIDGLSNLKIFSRDITLTIP
jgi:hypothetical protein